MFYLPPPLTLHSYVLVKTNMRLVRTLYINGETLRKVKKFLVYSFLYTSRKLVNSLYTVYKELTGFPAKDETVMLLKNLLKG